jgi:hypothetical protein
LRKERECRTRWISINVLAAATSNTRNILNHLLLGVRNEQF